MARINKTASEVRREAAKMAREYAADRHATGDPEGAGEFRLLARSIEQIRLTRD